MEGYVKSSQNSRIFCLIIVSNRWIFFALSLLGLRQWLARIMPQSLVLSVGAGIGLFIAYVTYFLFVPFILNTNLKLSFIGLCTHYLTPWRRASNCIVASGGLGVIGGDTNNFVGLGGCTPEHYLPNLPGYCDSVVMRSPTMWLGIFTGGWVNNVPITDGC